MREILFRGKRIDNGEWIKGFYAENGHGSSNIQPKCKFFGYLVKPETVGQFTNMTDCINNLLFEGDLVKAFDDKKCEFDQSYIGIVKFVGGAFGVEWHANNFQTFIPFRDIESNIMLVGNIFDNPEMLKNETPSETCKCQEYLAIGVDLYKRDIKNLRDDLNMLRKENRELKRLLKLAIEDFDTLFEETPECSFNLDCKYCPFGEIDTDGIPNCNEWRYKEEAEKLLEGDNVAEFQFVSHAKWEISSDGYYPYCKKCNARPENGKMTKYCPNCGAKMDGD